MKIYAPVKDANGVYASVKFVNGVGETDNPRLISWFKTHGYTLENDDTTDNGKMTEEIILSAIEPMDEDELMGYADRLPNFEDMNPNELREWMKANGYGAKIKNIRNKEKLLEIIRG